MYTLSSFERRLIHGDESKDVALVAGRAGWLSAQDHSGENIGTTDTHVLFVELKESAPVQPPPAGSPLGPDDPA